MNRDEIVKELNELVIELDEGFQVEKEPYDCGELVLSWCNDWICWFDDFDKHEFHIKLDEDNLNGCHEIVAKTGVISRFYNEAVNMLSKCEPKYTVQVIAQLDEGYLNFRKDTKKYFISDIYELGSTKTRFTMDEINVAKKNINLAVDWNKAVIKQVNE